VKIFFGRDPHGVRSASVFPARKQDFVWLLARDPTRISDVQIEFREGEIWNYQAFADRMNKLARAPVGI
jgi:hypothetical protein